MFDADKADKAVRFIQNLKHTKSPFNGKPFDLLPWQVPIVRDVYGTMNARGLRQYKYVYIEIPKKQGKSEIGAAFALKQLFYDGEVNGEVYGCAADKEQGTLVFDVACDMIEQVPALKKRTKPNFSTKMLTDKQTGTFYKVVSSEAYTKHGLNISAVIGDEIHAWPGRDMFDVMTKGAGDTRLQPLWIFITTAGDDPDRTSIGWEVHEKAESIIRARDAGDSARDIPTWYPVIYNYDGEDIYNEANWYKANPSLGVTIPIEAFREAAHEASLSKADERTFRWLRLNQWITNKLSTWLPLDLFDKTNASTWTRADLVGKECYLGLDLSSTTDLTALCLVFPPQDRQDDWRVIWDCWIPESNMADRIKRDRVPYDQWAKEGWIYPTPGDVVDYDKVEERILECARIYKVIEVGADTHFASMLIGHLQNEGIEVVDVPQYYTAMTDPINMIEVLLKSGIGGESIDISDGAETVRVPLLTHEANPVARWNFGNASVHKNGSAQVKFVKETKGKSVIRTKRIDLTVAWACAMARAKFYESNKSVYNGRGLLTL